MANKCPLCGQALPETLDQNQLESRLEKLSVPFLRAEKAKLKEELEDRLAEARELGRKQAEMSLRAQITESKKAAAKSEKEFDRRLRIETDRARKDAERGMTQRLEHARRQLQEFERRRTAEIARIRKEAAAAAQKEVRLIAQRETVQNERKLEQLQSARDKERLQHEADTAKLQSKLEDVMRKLEKRTGEQFGEEGELDLYADLTRAFPKDRIERIGRGVKGADILHHVMDGTREAGCIVYESKNVSTWSKAFVGQAKKYHTQYSTPYVMIVSRVFPNRKRGMCVECDVPVVEPKLAVALAVVMRDGLVEIARLRLSRVGSDGKSHKLFSYVVSDEFQTKFRDMADAIAQLRVQQQKERDWHENCWAKESDLHGRIDKRHREIDAKFRSVVKGERSSRALIVVDEREFVSVLN